MGLRRKPLFRFHKHHIIIFQAEISQGFRLGFYHFIHSFHLPKSPACVIISHMYSLLLIIIYLAFISLGLPDSLIGSAWPVMRLDLSADLSSAGIITMIIACGTVVSSLLSDKLTRKLGAGLVTAVSTALTGSPRLFLRNRLLAAVPNRRSLRSRRGRNRRRPQQLRRPQLFLPPHELASLLLGLGRAN